MQRALETLRSRLDAYKGGDYQAVLGDEAAADASAIDKVISWSADPGQPRLAEAISTAAEFWHFRRDEQARLRVTSGVEEEKLLVLYSMLVGFEAHLVPASYLPLIRSRLISALTTAADTPAPDPLAGERIRRLCLLAGESDAEALTVVARSSWQRFLDSGPQADIEPLAISLSAFEKLAELGPFSAPARVVEYFERRVPQLTTTVSPGADATGSLSPQLSVRELSAILIQQWRAFEVGAEPDRPRLRAALCALLLERFRRTRHSKDVDDLWDLADDASSGPALDEHAMLLTLLIGQACVLQAPTLIGPADTHTWLERARVALTKLDDAANAVIGEPARHREFVDLRNEIQQHIVATSAEYDVIGPDDPRHPHRASALLRAGRESHRRFQNSHSVSALNIAIRTVRPAAAHSFTARSCLLDWLLERHQLFNDSADLADAVEQCRLLSLQPPQSRAKALHAALAAQNTAIAQMRAGITVADDTLDDVITEMTAAIRASSPGDPLLPNMLRTVALAWRCRHRSGIEPQRSIDNYVAAARAAVESAGGDTGALFDLCDALYTRGTDDDLTQAVSAATTALQAARSGNDTARLLTLLGRVNVRRAGGPNAARFRQQGLADLARAASTVGADAGIRGHAAYLAAQLHAERQEHGLAADAYELVVEAIEQLSQRPTLYTNRADDLRRWSGSVADGAASALLAGRPDQAVRILERGRDVWRRQIARRRRILDTVHDLAPDLAVEAAIVAEAAEAYARGSSHEVMWDAVQVLGPLTRFAEAAVRPLSASASLLLNDSPDPQTALLRVAANARAVMEAVKSNDTRMEILARWDDIEQRLAVDHPEHAGFDVIDPSGLAKTLNDHGVVVVINVSRLGCHAVMLHDRQISYCDLPMLSLHDVADRHTALLEAMRPIEDGDRSHVAREQLSDAMSSCTKWLWQAVTEPVFRHLSWLDQPPRSAPRRLWWCPTGLLSLFPLHAAAGPEVHGAPCAMDVAVSSYTTTVSRLAGLLAARPAPQPRLLAVIASSPGLVPLDMTEELAALARWIPAGEHPLRDEEVTIHSIVGRLGRHEWLHVTGHGLAAEDGTGDPLLHLSNNTLTAKRLGWLEPLNCELAYLSACQTARGVPDHPDESEHMAAAFQAAGYRHAVGTLWSSVNWVAGEVAAAFYAELEANGRTASGVAMALHNAVNAVRVRHPDRPYLWAPFVHLGP